MSAPPAISLATPGIPVTTNAKPVETLPPNRTSDLKQAAREFESLFVNMMLRSMREASFGDPNFDSSGGDLYRDMFDEQIARSMSRRGGLGIAEILIRQLDTNLQTGATQDHATVPSAQAAIRSPIAAAMAVQGGNSGDYRQDFVARILPAAKQAAKALGSDVRSVIAHAALETGWGRSMPMAANGTSSNNLFGIKTGKGWNGEAARAATVEHVNGKDVQKIQEFRSYPSLERSIADYVHLLTGSKRYREALGTADDTHAFARALQAGGYATDPNYAGKLSRVAATVDALLANTDLKLRTATPLTSSTEVG
ncbi:MAG: flagellar assembly peptidoglycan hydrolase FlgJ [Steroidobacteraceae bacterium]